MRSLAMAGVKATAPGALHHKIGFERSNEHGYAVFEGLINVGEGHVGFYVIDPQTGDMWDGVSECGEITSPEIRHLQHAMRLRLGITQTQYLRIKRRGPMCDRIKK